MEQSLEESIRNCFHLEKADANAYSPLALAYLGDIVCDMVFRTVIVNSHNMAAHKYHKKVCNYVSAVAQSQMVALLMDEFTEKEMQIYKRGRNAKPFHKAKNASAVQYQRATGLEALIGYLYLNDEWERMLELLKIGMERLDQDNDR